MGFDIGSMFGGGLLGETSGYSTHRIFGSKPKVAKPRQVPLPQSQLDAIRANEAAFGDISKLGDLYSQEELRQLESILPGYGDQLTAGRATTDQLFSQAGQLLAGQVPQDVQDYVQRQAAQQALSGGYSGSPMARNLTLRDLGLTSLQGIQQGAALAGQGVNSMQAWDALARRNMLAPESMFITPAQQQSALETYELQRQAAKQNAYNVRAAPDPTQSGVYNSIMQVLGEVLSIYGGGGGWKNIGGQGGVPAMGGYGSYEGMYGGVPTYRATPVFNAGAYGYGNYVPQYPPGDYQGIDYTNPFG